MSQPLASPLADFWRFAADFRSLTSWIAKAAVAAPLVDLILNLGPPWPSRVGVAFAAAIAEVLILICAFEFWRGTASVRKVQGRLRQAVLATGAMFVVYMNLFSLFIENAPDVWNREAIGFAFQPQIGELVKSEPSYWTAFRLIERFHEPEAIWTRPSLVATRVSLLFAWLAMWTALGFALVAFVSLRWRRCFAIPGGHRLRDRRNCNG